MRLPESVSRLAAAVLLGLLATVPKVALSEPGPCISTSHGCLALNPDVTQSTIGQTICTPGYTKAVRPSTTYTNGVKLMLMRRQGIDELRADEYELDHVVSLGLGGHSRKLSNLQLQEWEGPAGAKAKDRLEIRLQRAVCRGQMTLEQAQDCIAEDWRTCHAPFH